MTSPTPAHQRAEAEANAKAARDKLSATLGELQERLNPRTLARTAVRDAQEAGEHAARVGADTVRRNPGAATGLVALAGLFLARRRIASLFHRKPKPGALPVLDEGTPDFIATPGDHTTRTQ